VGFVGTVGADGTIYASWNDGSTITFTESHDGGLTFAPSRPAVEVAPPYFGGAGGIPGVSRAMGFPQIAVDGREGKPGGTLYLVWSDYHNGDIDVFSVSSTDHGRTWSKPVRVNTDAIHNGIDQFFQWLAVDPITGDVYVQFYDRRDDPGNRKTGFTLARSTDEGKTFMNYAWAESPFESQQPAFLGDYTWSYEKGCQGKKLLPAPLRDAGVVTYIQPRLIPHLMRRGVIGLVALARRIFPWRCQPQLLVPTRRFHEVSGARRRSVSKLRKLSVGLSANHDPM
jgi:hypothetical protein